LLDQTQDDLLTAADRLVTAVSSQRNAESIGPDIVLAFDEAHVLSKKSGNIDTSAFLGLRQALRKMQKVNIFTVFLSTTGKIRDFVTPPKDDPSGRLSGEGSSEPTLVLLSPFTELGFDQMARQVNNANEGSDIEEIAKPRSMAMFGRPLLASSYILWSDLSSLVRKIWFALLEWDSRR